jgi:hypothetical protein
MAYELPFVCPICATKSWNPNDADHRYCGRCKRFVDEPALPETPADPPPPASER